VVGVGALVVTAVSYVRLATWDAVSSKYDVAWLANPSRPSNETTTNNPTIRLYSGSATPRSSR
jgi:hypothetical protein